MFLRRSFGCQSRLLSHTPSSAGAGVGTLPHPRRFPYASSSSSPLSFSCSSPLNSSRFRRGFASEALNKVQESSEATPTPPPPRQAKEASSSSSDQSPAKGTSSSGRPMRTATGQRSRLRNRPSKRELASAMWRRDDALKVSAVMNSPIFDAAQVSFHPDRSMVVLPDGDIGITVTPEWDAKSLLELRDFMDSSQDVVANTRPMNRTVGDVLGVFEHAALACAPDAQISNEARMIHDAPSIFEELDIETGAGLDAQGRPVVPEQYSKPLPPKPSPWDVAVAGHTTPSANSSSSSSSSSTSSSSTKHTTISTRSNNNNDETLSNGNNNTPPIASDDSSSSSQQMSNTQSSKYVPSRSDTPLLSESEKLQLEEEITEQVSKKFELISTLKRKRKKLKKHQHRKRLRKLRSSNNKK